MGIFIQRKKGSISFKAIVGFVILAILFSTVAAYFVKTNTSYASALPYMSAPTKIIETSSHFNPILLRGLEFFPNDPFAFRFTLDEGDTAVDDQEFKIEAHRLIKYFLASLTTPAQDLWVNLSPYEKDRVTPHELGLTDMGRDLLGEDYILKQLTASLTYPESPLGKKFWKKIYARANELYGTTNIAIDTFNKIWIIPDKAVVSVEGNRAFVKESSFKVMMESDYVAQKQNIVGVDLCVDPGQNNELYDNHIINHNGRTHRSAPTNDHNINKLSAQIAKEMILPVIEEEINKGQQFARLRQIYNALILATWFKKRLRRSVGEGLVSSRDKNKNILDKIYFDKNKIKGIEGTDPQIKEKIYNQYVEAYKKGVYNYIRPDFDEKLNRKINRRYYSGGFDARENEQCLQEVEEPINSVISTKANGPISGIDANGEFLRQSKPADTYAVDSGLKEEPKHDKKKSLRNAGIFLFCCSCDGVWLRLKLERTL
ncbi:MAG: hypothetical protein GY858_06675 [Candidatus Omnitrophica bacterium]|nr:hypothetical protein [Candidatus Omnitrophota bacterium]